ncbi:MAG: putative TetR family transcriptional regulator [Anaerocolumna sp.]|nr:putative TetR family transcriptional regulator [Anaerocolumna sp.]
MGSLSRKEKEREIRRNDIIDAAERVFSEKGYDLSTVDDVAKEAEFSKRTLYVYFNSKEQLYFEIMIKGYRLMIMQLQEEMPVCVKGNAKLRLKSMAEVLQKFKSQNPFYFSAIMEYENNEKDFQKGIRDVSKEECYEMGEKLLEILINIIEQGMEDGDFTTELQVKRTAMVLWSSLLGAFHTGEKKKNYLTNLVGVSPQELITATFELLMEGLKRRN